jgi:hypothetical protein
MSAYDPVAIAVVACGIFGGGTGFSLFDAFSNVCFGP